jgi:hypothetical protein
MPYFKIEKQNIKVKRFYDPRDLENTDLPEDQKRHVQIAVVDKLVWKQRQKTRFYQKHIWKLDNMGLAPHKERRIAEEERIEHRAVGLKRSTVARTPLEKDVDDEVDDAEQRIQVERVKSFRLRHGKGLSFMRHIYSLQQTGWEVETKTHKTHAVRRRYKNANGRVFRNRWIDIERIDKMTIKYGKGAKFQKVHLQIDWSQEQQIDDFADRTEITGEWKNADNGLTMEPLDPPYRLDPFQRVINVRWGGDDPDGFLLFELIDHLQGYVYIGHVYTPKPGEPRGDYITLEQSGYDPDNELHSLGSMSSDYANVFHMTKSEIIALGTGKPIWQNDPVYLAGGDVQTWTYIYWMYGYMQSHSPGRMFITVGYYEPPEP